MFNSSFVKTESFPVLTPVQFPKRQNIHTPLLLHIFHTDLCMYNIYIFLNMLHIKKRLWHFTEYMFNKGHYTTDV